MLRSVDIQQILLQTGSLEKIQHVQQQHTELEKRYFALQLQEEINQKKKAVQPAKGTEEVKIGEKEGRKKQQRRLNMKSKNDSADGRKLQRRTPEEIDQGKILDLIV